MFTRRTTLTRHEAAHNENKDRVRSEPTLSIPSSRISADDAAYSESRSATVSPHEGPQISPTDDLSQMPMHRPSQDFGYIPQTQVMPPRIRNDYSMAMRQPNCGQHHLNARYMNVPQRPSITSNPVSYGPPQPLEPPTSGTASGGNSPHMGGIGWSPSSGGGLSSPGGLDFGSYSELGNQQNFFSNNLVRRPQSTEPQDWSLRTSRNSTDSFGLSNITPDWGMPVMSEIKQERAFAL